MPQRHVENYKDHQQMIMGSYKSKEKGRSKTRIGKNKVCKHLIFDGKY
jgi:hypothetical protein